MKVSDDDTNKYYIKELVDNTRPKIQSGKFKPDKWVEGLGKISAIPENCDKETLNFLIQITMDCIPKRTGVADK